MPDSNYQLNAARVFECAAQGPKLGSVKDAVEIIGNAAEAGAALVVIPVERIHADFFDLRTGIAGVFIQKFVTYGSRVVILGDISDRIAQSKSLAALIAESNAGIHLWFVKDRTELRQRLS
jgi:hypothetical protein